MSKVIVLGSDIGTQNTGYATLIGNTKTLDIEPHTFGLIKTTKKHGDIRERIDLTGESLVQIVKELACKRVAIEDFTAQGKRAKNAGKTSQDMSFLLEHIRMLGKLHNFEVIIYENAYWKKKTLGIGGASKQQVMHFVAWKLPKTKELLKGQPDHVWDAMGIAYCRWIELIKENSLGV